MTGKKNLVQVVEVKPTTLIGKDIQTNEILHAPVDELIAEDFKIQLEERSQEGDGLFMEREEFHGQVF
ncbi:hypothetical protein D932_02455 [Enterococcus casseliflavus 14-MB-W-14]|uniref:hypothetical protein n=1 Tax=Enterococcus casseliflavus TaxID=37734 RepID=UPI00035486EB|nr:hypothetical protein [Enterococcus casseliflavus]EPH62557.1 hypothetical protein D932_02455 [Enterococcus casseliflavus 14-MB-W-14]NKD39759.1 hypothetical protein [Enterococcus casseliflavus]